VLLYRTFAQAIQLCHLLPRWWFEYGRLGAAMRMLSLLPGIIVHQFRKMMNTGKPQLLKPGAQAPDFRLEDESGNVQMLSDYHGRKIVLWWFVRASTPG
jgi:hypothetical protein